MGAYSRWALIKFLPFSASEVCLLCNKTINGSNKKQRCNKVSVKYSEENSVFRRVSYYLLLEFVWEGVGWGWALIQGWVLINFFCL